MNIDNSPVGETSTLTRNRSNLQNFDKVGDNLGMPVEAPEMPITAVPAKKMADDQRRILLRCYARPVASDRHVAVCLTLNLVTEGRTQREAIHKLHVLIKAYIADAVENNEFGEFVPRRAPARFYVEYIVARTIHSLASLLAIRLRFCAFTDRHKIPAHA